MLNQAGIPPVPLSRGQQLAVDQLREIEQGGPAVEILVIPADARPAMPAELEISLDCSGTITKSNGLPLRNRERFTIAVDRDFPFSVPTVTVPHVRWRGYPHVQWGRQLCLYASPSTEWNPSDGIRGFLDRLIMWLEAAAIGELDPDDRPLHPPVAYVFNANKTTVIRADIRDVAPDVQEINRNRSGATASSVAAPQFAVAICERIHSDRFDVKRWVALDDWEQSVGDVVAGGTASQFGAIALLTAEETSFEYPGTAPELLKNLEEVGVTRDALIEAFARFHLPVAQLKTSESDPDEIYFFIGTPSRRTIDGTLRQHLVCWQFQELGQQLVDLLGRADALGPSADKIRNKVRDLTDRWLRSPLNQLHWISVMEDRPEVTIRRDFSTASSWLRGKRVLLLGAGALGAPIAQFCVQAGVDQMLVVDNGIVTTGILVRQPYSYADIGRNKAIVTRDRLNSMRPDDPVEAYAYSVQSLLSRPPGIETYDLVIDATADRSVAGILELNHSTARDLWPPVISLSIGHDARRGIATVSRTHATGLGRDISRRAMLAARGQSAVELEDFALDLFPLTPRSDVFTPEPGCSSPTFVGSAAELAALSGRMFDHALTVLSAESNHAMHALFARVDGKNRAGIPYPAIHQNSWSNDVTVIEIGEHYEVRISQSAINEMRAEVRRGARLRGPHVETGGVLLGRIDDACRIIWVDVATGPPPDSLLSPLHFDRGLSGISAIVESHKARSGKETTYLGEWHTHPYGAAAPSATDNAGMAELIAKAPGAPRRALLLILAGDFNDWQSHSNHNEMPALYAELVHRTSQAPPTPPDTPKEHFVVAWPGGWSQPSRRVTRRRRRSWRPRWRQR